MFQIELYKEHRLLERCSESSEGNAMRAIDAMITAVHHGKHGNGIFRVNADQVNDLGFFQASLFDSDTFPYPVADLVR